MSDALAPYPPSRRLAKTLAFLRRAFFRRRGWYEQVDERARWWLPKLSQPSHRLGFLVTLEHLALEYELFDEEFARLDDVLELQVQALSLWPEFGAAEDFRYHMTCSIANGIFPAVFQNTPASSCQGALLSLVPAEETLRIFSIRGENLDLVGFLPQEQGIQLLGLVRRVERMGFKEWKRVCGRHPGLPSSISIQWDGRDAVRLTYP